MAAIAPDPAAALRTIRALRDENFDVVNIHEPLCPGPSLTALLFHDGPMVGTFHRSGDSGWYKALKPLVTWRAKRLTVRVAVSAEARETVAGMIGGPFEVLWNGIDVDVYQRADAWPAKGPTIMFVGRHEPRKGLGVLIEAVRRLGPDVTVWIASEGPETARLQSETAGDDRFEWLGMIDEVEKIARMRGAGVICAPSLHGESFGVIVLEGLASGTPVVAADLPGYRNVVRPSVDALLVPPGSPAALADALSVALERGPEVEAMVENGLERAKSFSLARLAERYVDLYERALRS